MDMSQAAIGSVTSSTNATVPVVRTGDQQDDPQMQAPASVIPRIAVATPLFECRVQYVRHEKKRTKYGGHQLTWLVNHPGHELHGQLLASYYPDNRQKGSWSPSSKFAKLW